MKRQVKAKSKQDYQQSYRKLGRINIFFATKDSIYIEDTVYKKVIVANHWFSPKGFYRYSWSPFTQKLKRGNFQNLYDVIGLATQLEVSILTARKMPDNYDKTTQI